MFRDLQRVKPLLSFCSSPSPVRSGGTAAYYRPPPGAAPSGGPRFVVYTTQSGVGQLPPTSVYSSASGSSAPRLGRTQKLQIIWKSQPDESLEGKKKLKCLTQQQRWWTKRCQPLLEATLAIELMTRSDIKLSGISHINKQYPWILAYKLLVHSQIQASLDAGSSFLVDSKHRSGSVVVEVSANGSSPLDEIGFAQSV